MDILISLGAAVLQADTSAGSNDLHLIMIFTGIVALSLLLAALTSAAVGVGVLKEIKQLRGLVTELHGKALPIFQKSTDVLTDLAPKIRTVSENVTQISYTVREKVDEVGETITQVNRTVQETNQRTRGQVDHVDRMVSEVLTTTEDLAHTVSHGIRIPVKQVAGMIAGLRVGIETLVKNFTPNNGRGPGGSAL